jgi:DNA helicase II / ATP-dependent DNA helicase PcrA
MTNTKQKAIEKSHGPCLIMAGAGTGKTYTIQKKVAHLVNDKIFKASELLCLTFSNEATNNLNKKIQEELKTTSDITIKTFHGFCAEILREFAHLIKLDPGFDILLPEDAVVWFYRYLDIQPYYADLYFNSISSAKDFGISLAQIDDYTKNLRAKFKDIKDLDKYAEKLEFEFKTLHLKPSDTKEQRKDIKDRKNQINEFLKSYYEFNKYNDFVEAWKKYDKLKKDKNVLDYSDLNFSALELFNKFGAKEISQRYKHVIIDEFQDTNKLQFELIEHIAKDHRNITVVGDPNQSIYGFRGAYKESFEHFKEIFQVNEKTDIFRLDESRRSPNTILKISHKLIQNNYENPKECFEVKNFKNIEGKKVETISLKNGAEEARNVAEIVEKEIAKKTPLNEICILHRTHAQSKLLRQALEAKGIPFISAGKTDLMQRQEIRTVISYLSMIHNLIERTGTGEQAWWNLFHYHNALTPDDTVKIGRYLKKTREDKVSIDFAVLTSLGSLDLSSEGKKVIARVVSKLKELVKSSNKALPDLILDIYETIGLNRAFTHERSIHNVESLMNLKNFYEVAENYYAKHDKSLGSFIDYLEVLDKLGVNIDASKIQDINAVRLMTIHAVKGLEFDKVIVTNLADKRFPLTRTYKEPLIPKEFNPDIIRYLDTLGSLSDKDKESAIKDYERMSLLIEERRLCYVAFTRAKSSLTLTYSNSYNKEDNSSSASIFLEEIEYNSNKDITFIKDDEEKCTIFAPCSKFEQFKSLLKKQLINSLDSDDFNSILSRVISYTSVRDGIIPSYPDMSKLVDNKELLGHIKMYCDKCSCLHFNKSSFTFSPTALLDYEDCPKKYELKHIFQMPERGAFGWSAVNTGKFVHDVLEEGVKSGFKTKEEFVKLCERMALLPDYKGVDLKDVFNLVSIFWERHKGRYDSKSLVEDWIKLELDGFNFVGKFDRIDFISSTDVEIIDYKTNQKVVDPKKRAWQLGFYALGVKKQFGYNPVKLTLEMLRLEKPYEAVVDASGNVTSGRSKGFNLKDVEKEMISCAESIKHDYETEFKVTEDDAPCRYCGYKFYCPKWEE